MQIIVCIVSVLFGALSLIAALSQLKKGLQPSHVLMGCGSLILLGAVICNIVPLHWDWCIALIGTVMICAAAVWNGKQSENFHWQHHLIRIALSAALVIGFIVL